MRTEPVIAIHPIPHPPDTTSLYETLHFASNIEADDFDNLWQDDEPTFDTLVNNDGTSNIETESIVFIAYVIGDTQHEQNVENTAFCWGNSIITPEENIFTKIEYGTKIEHKQLKHVAGLVADGNKSFPNRVLNHLGFPQHTITMFNRIISPNSNPSQASSMCLQLLELFSPFDPTCNAKINHSCV
jgi:hypothetical protein